MEVYKATLSNLLCLVSRIDLRKPMKVISINQLQLVLHDEMRVKDDQLSELKSLNLYFILGYNFSYTIYTSQDTFPNITGSHFISTFVRRVLFCNNTSYFFSIFFFRHH